MGPHEEAEIQRKALRCGKNLAFSEDTCLEKERVRSKVTPRKVGVGLKRRRGPSKRRLFWRLAFFIFFRPILSTLSVSRNQILTHLPLFGFLDSLLSEL